MPSVSGPVLNMYNFIQKFLTDSLRFLGGKIERLPADYQADFKSLVKFLKYVADNDYMPGDKARLKFYNYKSAFFLEKIDDVLETLAFVTATEKNHLASRISSRLSQNVTTELKSRSAGLKVFLRDIISSVQEFKPLVVAEYKRRGANISEDEKLGMLKLNMAHIDKTIFLINYMLPKPNVTVVRPASAASPPLSKTSSNTNVADEYGTKPVAVRIQNESNAPDEYGTYPVRGGRTRKGRRRSPLTRRRRY